MKFKALTRVFGVLLSAGLVVLAYLNLFIGIALSIDGNDWFASTFYIFIALAIANFVGLFFVKKKPLVSIVISAIATFLVLAVTIYLIFVGLIIENPMAFLIYVATFVAGGLTVLFAVFYKKRSVQINNWFLQLSWLNKFFGVNYKHQKEKSYG